MSTLNQALAGAAPADAVTGEALRWQRLLADAGVDGEIVAEHVHPELAGRVRRLDEGGAALLRQAPVLLHYSIGSAAVEAALAGDAPLGLVYHNVTPAHLLAEANPAVAAACARGREGLARFRGRLRALIADSAFNARELAEAGLGEATVVPLLLSVPAPHGEADAEAGRDPGLIVSVGRVVPSKRVEDVVRVACLYQRSRDPGAELAIVGSWEGFERYRSALDALVASLGARGVRFLGRIGDEERDALYRRAGAYLCMSLHEGFCAPLVEAMASGTPVVARACGAVPETLGGAGLALDPSEDLVVYAEALHEVNVSPVLRAALRHAGRARLRELSPERVAAQAREAVAPLLEP